MTFTAIIAAVLTLSSCPYSFGGELELVERVNLPTVEARENHQLEEQPAILKTLASIVQLEVNLSDIKPTYFSDSFDPSISLNVRRDDLGRFDGMIQVAFGL